MALQHCANFRAARVVFGAFSRDIARKGKNLDFFSVFARCSAGFLNDFDPLFPFLYSVNQSDRWFTRYDFGNLTDEIF